MQFPLILCSLLFFLQGRKNVPSGNVPSGKKEFSLLVPMSLSSAFPYSPVSVKSLRSHLLKYSFWTILHQLKGGSPLRMLLPHTVLAVYQTQMPGGVVFFIILELWSLHPESFSFKVMPQKQTTLYSTGSCITYSASPPSVLTWGNKVWGSPTSAANLARKKSQSHDAWSALLDHQQYFSPELIPEILLLPKFVISFTYGVFPLLNLQYNLLLLTFKKQNELLLHLHLSQSTCTFTHFLCL